MEEWCTAWFTADASRLRAIHVNAATISELQRHPYISHEQAVEIVVTVIVPMAVMNSVGMIMFFNTKIAFIAMKCSNISYYITCCTIFQKKFLTSYYFPNLRRVKF